MLKPAFCFGTANGEAPQGWFVDKVERRITRTLKRDLWSIADAFPLRCSETMAIQITSGSNANARVRKTTDSPHFRRSGPQGYASS